MLVSMEKAHNVVAVSPSDPARVVTVAQFPGEAPERVLIIPSNSDLFVAKYDLGIVVKIPASSFSNYVGLPLVITEGEAGQAGTFTVLTAAGNDVSTFTFFNDPSSPHFEGAAFVPAGLTGAGIGTIPSSTSSIGAELTVAGVTIIVVATLVLAFIVKRGRKKSG
jgi:hypothetical protein